MKKLLVLYSCVGLLFVGCKDPENPNPDPVKVHPELKISATDPAVTIDQDGLGATISVGKDIASITLGITTNIERWSYTEDVVPEWISATPDGNKLVLEIEDNKAVQGRSAEFGISVKNENGELKATVKVNQTGVEQATLAIDDQYLDLTIPEAGGDVGIAFTSNQSAVTVTIPTAKSWLTYTTEGNTITFAAGANNTGVARDAQVTVTAGGGDNTATKTVNVSQGALTTLAITPSTITMAAGGGAGSVTITSNHATVTVTIPDNDKSWLSYTKTGDTYEFTAAANTTLDGRSTQVAVVAGEGANTATDVIVVSQDSNVKALRYVVKTTAADKAVALPVLSSTDATIGITVDYGDGSVAQTLAAAITTSTAKHTYAAAGEYTVTITTDNRITGFSFKGNTYLYKVLNNSLDMSGVTTLKECFYNCTLLTEVAVNTVAKCVNATNCESLFYGCKALTAVPAGLVGNLTKVTTFAKIFQNCSLLSSVPAGMFEGMTTVTAFNNAFYGCKELTEVPARIFKGCSNVKTFQYLYCSCAKLSVIADDAFAGCVKVEDFTSTFTDCVLLTAIPTGLFSEMTSLKWIEYSFQGCSGLKSLPVSLFDNNLVMTSVDYAFMNCTGLTGESPYKMIGGQKVHLYERELYPDEMMSITSYDGAFRNDESLTDFATIVQKGWAN